MVVNLPEGCILQEPSPGFNTPLDYVKYKDTILPLDFVASGLADRIRGLEARREDVFVASFPKSGTTWMQVRTYCTYSQGRT